MQRILSIISSMALLALIVSASSGASLVPQEAVRPVMGQAEDEPPLSPGFSYDGCATDEPPSGTYLDMVLLELFDYDCVTGTLTPAGTATTSCRLTGTSGNHVPVAGACAILNEGSSSSSHTAWIYLAVTGSYEKVTYSTHSHYPAQACITNAVTYTTWNLAVTFVSKQHSCSMSCEPSWWYAHAVASGPSGTLSFSHSSSAYRCY